MIMFASPRGKTDGSAPPGQTHRSLTKPKVGGAAHPAGACMLRNDKELWVTSTRGNNVQQIDLDTSKVKLGAAPVGMAPFTIVFPPP